MNISKICCLSAAALSVSALAPASTRAGIIWNESINGDLADLNRYGHPDPAQRGTFTDLGPLTPGTSAVFGAAARTTNGAITTVDGDAIRFTIPAGTYVESILLTHDQPLGMREFFRLSSGGPGPYYMTRSYPPAQIVAGTQDLIGLLAPADGLSPGNYIISWEGAGPADSTMNYSITFATIPSPAAAAPFAFMAFAVRRRRPISRGFTPASRS